MPAFGADEIEGFVAGNPGQGTAEEYAYLRDVVAGRVPCRLLIFGVGKDSKLWVRANEGGTTVFVEHEPEWIAKTQQDLPDTRIVRVRYGTRRWQWRFLKELPRLLWMSDLPSDVAEAKWDVIFVDSPQGGKASRPGRMKSIYTASVVAARGDATQVLVHDCDRKVERVYCDRYLGHARLVREVRTLRHYDFTGAPKG